VPHLRARTPTNALLLQLRSKIIASLTRFFEQEGFVQCHTPVITSSDCEGAGEVFTVSSNVAHVSEQQGGNKANAKVEHFFRDPKYLTVSAQLHLEALAMAVNKVWTLSPTFRAEKSDTPRHLSEFYMLEAEQCFLDSPHQIMELVENMLRFIAKDLIDSRVVKELLVSKQKTTKDDVDLHVDLETLRSRWKGLAASDWKRIQYREAVHILSQAQEESGITFDHPVFYDEGLSAEHERYLAVKIGNGSPVFITDYPSHQKPFYMSKNTEHDTAECFDLLVPDLCELVGGSMREYRSDVLLKNMQAKNVGGLNWYADLRKYGSVSHGGFGMGFDRLMCYLSGTSNLRDVVAFPRWHGRCEC
jgi:asparaginyl-tRNA synthetase